MNDHFSRNPPLLSGKAPLTITGAVAGVDLPGPTPQVVKARLAELEASPRHDDPVWWNDVGGSHLRLGEPEKAAAVLEQAVVKFPNDYGVHANLGTAYHLLGRYSDAEREIAADLRIDPHAHGGLEVYHLALLQYLAAPKEWQKKHVFLDEWTDVFLGPASMAGLDSSLKRGLDKAATMPEYRSRLNLAESPAQEQGVAYMTSLNRTQPACFVMAGILALNSRDGITAKRAFEKAIALGSIQSEQLRNWIQRIERMSPPPPPPPVDPNYWVRWIALGALGAVLAVQLVYLLLGRRLAAAT